MFLANQKRKTKWKTRQEKRFFLNYVLKITFTFTLQVKICFVKKDTKYTANTKCSLTTSTKQSLSRCFFFFPYKIHKLRQCIKNKKLYWGDEKIAALGVLQQSLQSEEVGEVSFRGFLGSWLTSSVDFFSICHSLSLSSIMLAIWRLHSFNTTVININPLFE